MVVEVTMEARSKKGIVGIVEVKLKCEGILVIFI